MVGLEHMDCSPAYSRQQAKGRTRAHYRSGPHDCCPHQQQIQEGAVPGSSAQG